MILIPLVLLGLGGGVFLGEVELGLAEKNRSSVWQGRFNAAGREQIRQNGQALRTAYTPYAQAHSELITALKAQAYRGVYRRTDTVD